MMASLSDQSNNTNNRGQETISEDSLTSSELLLSASPLELPAGLPQPSTSTIPILMPRRFQAVKVISDTLCSFSNPHQTLHKVLKQLAQLFEVEIAMLMQHDPQLVALIHLRPVYMACDNVAGVTELEASRVLLESTSFSAGVYRTGQPDFINNIQYASSLVQANHLHHITKRNMMAIVLHYDESQQGVCTLINRNGDFTPDDLADFQALTNLLSIVLKNIKLTTRLEQEERRHLATIDATVDGFVEVSPEMKITLFSKGAENLTGWKTSEAIGRHCYEVLQPHSPENEPLCNKCPLRQSFRYGTSITNVETLLRNRDGEDSWTSCSYNSVTDERGQVVSGLIAIKDIYRLKALSDELRQQSQQQESLIGVNNAINGLSNLEEIYRVSLEAISRAISFDLGTIHSLNSETGELSLMTLLEKESEKPLKAVSLVQTNIYNQGGQGLSLENEEFERQARLRQYRASQNHTYRAKDARRTGLELPTHYLHECEALRQNEPYMAVNLPDVPICGVISDFKEMQSHLCVPIKTQERSYGVLHLASSKPYAFWGSDFVLALSVCKQIAVGAERAKLFAEVDRLARTDPLTGLYNKRELWERLDREIRRSERRESPLSLILIDLDRLKWINDCFGHTQGDNLLTRLSELIREQCRASDVAFRYGGDELCVLLPDTGQEEAQIAAERLARTARQIKLDADHDRLMDGQTLVTMSIGIASYPGDALTASQLFECADAAMYRAKETGKDRIMIFNPESDLNRLNYRRRTGLPEKDDRLSPPRRSNTGTLPPLTTEKA